MNEHPTPLFGESSSNGHVPVIIQSDNGNMPVLNDEVPDEGDFDAGRRRGEFDDITPEDFIRGSAGGNPPGWLDAARVGQVRRQVPMVYVEVVPVHTDEFGRIAEIGTLLRRIGRRFRGTHAGWRGACCTTRACARAIARTVAKDLDPWRCRPCRPTCSRSRWRSSPHPRA